MGALRTRLLATAALAIIAVIAMAIFLFYATSHLTFGEMDWNDDGVTSIGEIIQAIDLGVRVVERDGVSCSEYYYLKDGTEAYLRCPARLSPR